MRYHNWIVTTAGWEFRKAKGPAARAVQTGSRFVALQQAPAWSNVQGDSVASESPLK